MIAATPERIGSWFRQAPEGATHMVIVCDEMSWEDYPEYVMSGQDPRAVAAEQNGKALQKVMEVYHLGYDLDKQLVAKHAWNYEMPLDGYGDRVLRLVGELSPEELEGLRSWPGKLAEVAQAELDRRVAVAAATVAKEEETRREALRRASRVATG
jgi:hypothetical protein